MREFNVSFVEGEDAQPEEGSGWAEVVGERKVKTAAFAEFGFAEEVLAWHTFEDGTHEVGIGEALRPYIRVYKGEFELKAKSAFWTELQRLASLS